MKRTPAAVLRAILGIKDFEMAELLGCSRATIHSLESGRLKMSEGMATRMYHETEISPRWLLAGDPKKPPKSFFWEPYTKAIFERAQARKASRDHRAGEWVLGEALVFCAQLVAILSSANKRKEYYLARYKAQKAIEALREEYGQDAALYSSQGFTLDRDEALAVLEKLRESCEEVTAQITASRGKSGRRRKAR